jgi:hypothetical protein
MQRSPRRPRLRHRELRLSANQAEKPERFPVRESDPTPTMLGGIVAELRRRDHLHFQELIAHERH